MDDWGTVWVLDHGNERIMRFNLTNKEPIGSPVSFMKGSYSVTASHTNTTRVFSNMLKFFEHARVFRQRCVAACQRYDPVSGERRFAMDSCP